MRTFLGRNLRFPRFCARFTKMTNREFDICVFRVGMRCKKPQGETSSSGASNIRFCDVDPSACDGAEIVHTVSEAEAKQKELDILPPELPQPK